MTNITGKIYQMQNAAGTENRFPRTVMEAVLGLNSYLQDQFGSLADIYMPIEGISEAFTGQEFVYRKSPNTIKAKSLTLGRIKGKSLAWNQLVNIYRVTGANGVTATLNSDGTVTLNGTATNTGYVDCVFSSVYLMAGHKVLFYSIGTQSAQIPSALTPAFVTTNGGSIITIGQNGPEFQVRFRFNSGDSFSNKKVYTYLVDLTLLYGTEIDGLTDEQILAKYEANFGTGYHPSAQKLISNDAESLETVGFNQWDEEWIVGILYGAGIVGSGDRIVSKNKIPVIAGQTYHFRVGANDAPIGQYETYDANGNLISYYGSSTSELVIPTGVAFIRFCTNSNYGTAYNHDICINLSDTDKNGTYEPYWKRTLNLGLNSLKVKSHNIWDEEWESGYIDVTSGNLVGSTTYRRNKNAIKVFPSTAYYLKGTNFRLCFYDANGGYISYLASQTNTIFSTPVNAYLMRFYSENANIEVGAVCINISSSFNGQYEPYGDITVNGLKSAGSVYDEIVGNKYIKRVEGVNMGGLSWTLVGTSFVASVPLASNNNVCICSKYEHSSATTSLDQADKSVRITSDGTKNIAIKDSAYNDPAVFQAAMNGVMFNYELATPIEYDLVEPLIYTTKAGTTEARISPNEDGLSAPFCCDMTYSASDNNDADSAQYAATAGRLLNTRKIWGQDFNGSEDVDGNLVSNGTLQGTQLKSTVQTGTQPLVVSSTTMVANLVAEKASKLLTARTIWGRSFDGSNDISGALEGVTTISASGLATLNGGMTIPLSADAKHGTLDFIDGDAVKHIVVVSREEDIPASPDLYTLYVVATTTV